jgi:coenzyme F420-reducing hydrogenase delta subunit
MILKCTTENHFKTGTPSLKESWKWLKSVLNEFMKTKQRLQYKRNRIKELLKLEEIVEKIKILFQMDDYMSYEEVDLKL